MARRPTKARVPKEIGASGLRTTSGQIIQTDEPNVALKFPNSVNTFASMRSDPIISGVLTMIKQFIRKVEFDIEAYGGINANAQDKKKAEIVRRSLFVTMDRSFDQMISDICSFIEQGFSFHEPLYKVDKGNIIWKDFASRPASSISGFKFDDKGRLTHVKQYVYKDMGTFSQNASTVEIPVERLLHFRTDSEKNNPLGRSILKNAYKSWYFKTKLEELEAIGVEREMNGLPMIEIPIEYFNADPETEPEKYAVFQEFVRIGQNARNNEQACVILPSDVDETGNKLFSFELIASKGTRSLDTSKIIERYDFRIAQSLLGDFLLMGSSSTGSFALSDNKVHIFLKSLEAYLEVISEQFNRIAIPKLYELNGWNSEKTCQLVYKPIGTATLSELSTFVNATKNFITPDLTLENALRARADLPERDISNQYIEVPTSTHQAYSQRIGMTNKANPENTTDEVLSDEQIDEIAKSLMDDYRGVS